MARGMAPDESLIGRTIAGKYRIEELVGGGAMGAVYKARQLMLDKLVAVKVLHRAIQKDAQFALRFKREAKAASRLDHPNSLRVLDFGEEPDGLLYMVMELIDGTDLFELHKRHFPLPTERIAAILSQALAALAVAHDQGVIHRDLKPENIMVLAGKDDEGRPIDVVKVCDFGIAKIVDSGRANGTTDASGRLSTRGLVVGTPEYMSPEQGRGEELDARADIYSMGVILYQLLAGKVPFEADSAIGVVLKHVTEDPIKPSALRDGVDPRLEAIALKAMQKRKEDRFASAREMRAALRPMLDPGALSSHPEIPLDVARRLSPTQLESAATVAVPVPAAVIPQSSTGDRNATFVAAELGDDIEIPKKRPSWAFVIVAPLVLGAIGALAVISFRVHPAAQTDPSASVATTAPLPTAAPSVATSAAPSASHAASVEKPRPKPTATAPVSTPTRTVAEAGAPEPIDPDNARVAIVAVRAEGASDAAVRGAIDVGRVTSCYKDGLRSPNAKGKAFRQTLEIETDQNGVINYAAMPAPDFLSSLQSCFVKTLIGAKIPGASNAKANVDLAFSPR